MHIMCLDIQRDLGQSFRHASIFGALCGLVEKCEVKLCLVRATKTQKQEQKCAIQLFRVEVYCWQ